MEPVPSPEAGWPIGPWRRWFAWFPVQTFDGERLWLRFVARRRIQRHDHLPPQIGAHWWQYARKEDALPCAF